MRLKKYIMIVIIFSLILFFLSGCVNKRPENKNTAGEKFKVGFIYVGKPGDAGWTFSHDQARKYLEANMKGVQTVYLENVPEGTGSQKSIEELVQQGCKLIFATSYGYGDAVMAVARKHPDVVFMHCSGSRTAKNVGTYFGRMYQARYLSGIVAGRMTSSNTLGFVAAFPIAEVISGINAFTLGAQSVNPEVTVKVEWTNTWFDPVKEKATAERLLAEGADVIAQHQDTYIPVQVAEKAHKYSIGYNSDMSQFAPEGNLTSPVWNWGPYYVKVVKTVMTNSWKSEAYLGGVGEGIVALATISDKVPAEVKQMVADQLAAIKSGSLKIFAGPVIAQDGKLKVKAGQAMTDKEIDKMDWFIEGIEGTISPQA